MIEPLLLTTTRVSTFGNTVALTAATGFFFERDARFLTDARTHRGTSGAPVVLRSGQMDGRLPWKLLGVHSPRMDMGSRDLALDESLGLNCAWYADPAHADRLQRQRRGHRAAADVSAMNRKKCMITYIGLLSFTDKGIHGNVRSRSLRAYTAGEMDKILAKLP